ncbi:MAG: acetyl-CoA carboxylase carboxyltransferase subunit beta, partial [Alphaproteobacteria bacterium]|nr:acetyl-CoA carboxylase carboxyltransferase subunit beta [Alphaproteobacteria bacterium]
MLFHRELSEAQNVCPSCNHHMHINPRERFGHLFDGGLFAEIDVPKPVADPLGFRDQKKYPDRMKTAQKTTGEVDAMLLVEGEVLRTPFVAAGQNFKFMGGSMGMHVGNAIIAGAERAIAKKCPFVIFTAAGGARMQEGILSLMQMPRTTVAVQMLKEAGLPFIVVLTNPTTGGVTASYAMLGDVHIAEPNALIGFAGARVIEQTIREKLPEGFQRSEYLLDHGMLDLVSDRKDIREALVTICRMLMRQSPAIKGDLPSPEAGEADQSALPAPTG